MRSVQVIESREMMDESKDPDTIDGAVRVAHLVNSLVKNDFSFLSSIVNEEMKLRKVDCS